MDFFKQFLQHKQKVEKLELPCTHDWQVVSKFYGPPRKDISAEGVPADKLTLEKALFGVTTVLWECSVCGNLRKEEMLGTDENQLFELLAKAKQHGMQYVKDGDTTYAIAEVPPVQSDKVPLR